MSNTIDPEISEIVLELRRVVSQAHDLAEKLGKTVDELDLYTKDKKSLQKADLENDA